VEKQMEKEELIKAIAGRLKIETPVAESAVNQVIAELVSPFLLRKPGQEVGFINDNHCRNNCPKGEVEVESQL
jgi:hypothetical protein